MGLFAYFFFFILSTFAESISHLFTKRQPLKRVFSIDFIAQLLLHLAFKCEKKDSIELIWNEMDDGHTLIEADILNDTQGYKPELNKYICI